MGMLKIRVRYGYGVLPAIEHEQPELEFCPKARWEPDAVWLPLILHVESQSRQGHEKSPHYHRKLP